MGEKSGYGLARCLWLTVFCEVAIKLLTRLQSHLKAHLEKGDYEEKLPSSLTFLAVWTFPHNCFTTRQLAFLGGNDSRKSRECPRWNPQPLCNLISKMTSYHFSCIVDFRNISVSPAHIQGAKVTGLHKDIKARRQKPLGSLLEATDHNCIKPSLFQLH